MGHCLCQNCVKTEIYKYTAGDISGVRVNTFPSLLRDSKCISTSSKFPVKHTLHHDIVYNNNYYMPVVQPLISRLPSPHDHVQ